MYYHMPTCLEGPISRNRLQGLFNTPTKAETEVSAPSEDIRRDLVERVRLEIAEGIYDTPEKWEAALDRLAEDLE
ncbi:MAG TPA: hypothetical protein VN688_28565 [Gemmataceae bacterium]|nr:hypothetical protein [Gemmataceae bacterium]